MPPALAVAQERGADGRALIAAFVAGNEVMIRIGRATGHTNEARGFHAPGTTGPFGAAVAAGHLLRLDAAAMTNALGIAGSLAGGLLEFARGDGGMVKRLHLGRASEAGVLAASLAADGFAGPRTVLEGEFGFLKVFCTKWDEAELTRGLGEEFVVSSTVLKRYPCHATAHAAVRAVRDLQAEHGFTGAEVEAITVTGTRAHDRAPQHPGARRSDAGAVQHPVLRRAGAPPRGARPRILGRDRARATRRSARSAAASGWCRSRAAEHGGMASTVTVTLADGRRFERRAESGMLEPGELEDKFLRLTRGALGERGAAALYRAPAAAGGRDEPRWLS